MTDFTPTERIIMVFVIGACFGAGVVALAFRIVGVVLQ